MLGCPLCLIDLSFRQGTENRLLNLSKRQKNLQKTFKNVKSMKLKNVQTNIGYFRGYMKLLITFSVNQIVL